MLEKRGMDAGVLGQVLAKQEATPGNPLVDILSSVIVHIDKTVITQIKAGHVSTQNAIISHSADLRRTTEAAVESKKGADKKDQEWFACVKHEKTLREQLLQAEGRAQTAQNEQGFNMPDKGTRRHQE